MDQSNEQAPHCIEAAVQSEHSIATVLPFSAVTKISSYCSYFRSQEKTWPCELDINVGKKNLLSDINLLLICEYWRAVNMDQVI